LVFHSFDETGMGSYERIFGSILQTSLFVLKPLLMHTQWSSVYQQVSSIFSVSSKKRKIPRNAQRDMHSAEMACEPAS
jgi:hypothetical protein